MKRRSESKIRYVGFYNASTNTAEARTSHLSATNKMDYICSVLNRIGHGVLLVSPSRTTNRSYLRGKQLSLADGVMLKLFPTFPWGNRFQRALSVTVGNCILFVYLIFSTRRSENVVVYHSLALMRAVRYAKKVRGFRMVLEVEEIYQDVQPVGSNTGRAEYATFRAADAFILPTELLNDKVNPRRKPHVVIHGTYNLEVDRGLSFNDGRTHAVYAGVIDSLKGATIAAEAARYLDSKYHIHIIGFGKELDIILVQQKIAQVLSATECRLTYEGMLQGEEFLAFLQKCHIGLSTQHPEAAFNESSFPSKILSYMANGLTVVSVRIPAITESRIAEGIVFYSGHDPRAIAEAMRGIRSPEKRISSRLIEQLDRELVRDLRGLLNESAVE